MIKWQAYDHADKPSGSLAVPWLRHLVTSHLPWKTRFAPKPFHVVFAVDKVALGQVLLQVLWFSPVNIIPLGRHTHISPGG
jgi:hypothetical protein